MCVKLLVCKRNNYSHAFKGFQGWWIPDIFQNVRLKMFVEITVEIVIKCSANQVDVAI